MLTFRRCASAGKRQLRRALFEKNLGEQIRERKTNRRVSPVSHGLSGTKRESPISKGFLQHQMRHGFNENETRISLKSLAIPAEVARHSKSKA
jgi:hypothetical protein